MRNAASKVMWIGRATVFMVGLAVILALVLGVATTALGATGATFILGKPNSATTPTSLVSTLADAAKSAFIVQNKSGGPALDLRVGNTSTSANSVAPMKVNSQKVVTNLNADKLDGMNSTDLTPTFYTASVFVQPSNSSRNAGQALCRQGDVAVSGGYELNDGTDNVWLSATGEGTNFWNVFWQSSDGSDAQGGTVYAICVEVGK